MRRRLLVFGLFGVFSLAAALGLVPGGSAATSGTTPWNGAARMPGAAALQRSSSAQANSVSCAAAGECAAGGGFTDGSGGHAFVVNETNGVWGRPIEVPGLAAFAIGSAVDSISCAAPGECAAGGAYVDGFSPDPFGKGDLAHVQAFVVSETNGVWGDAIEVPGFAALNSGNDGLVESVSCAAPGECAAGGFYVSGDYGSSGSAYQAFVVNETNGVWGDAITLPNVGSASSLSCPTAGNCAAGTWGAFVADETNGVWGDAIELPGMATLNTANWAFVNSVSCATVGNCSAGGFYKDGSSFIWGEEHAFVVSETNGVWGDAIEVPGIAGSGNYTSVDSVSCAAAGDCLAGGSYAVGRYAYPRTQAFLVNETNGVWGHAFDVRGTAALNSGEASVSSVSCAAPDNCAAGVDYTNIGGYTRAFVVSQTNGVWGHLIEVPGPPAPNSAEYYASVSSVSCGAAGDCAAVGSYTRDRPQQAFVVNETNGVWGHVVKLGVPPPSLRAGTTSCNGTYAGTGSNVVVPAHGTCTLLPGTRVTGNITVRQAGNLNLNGVTIGGNLTILPGVTKVCGSTIGGNIHATGGSLILGGPNCAANKISGSVVVQYEPYKLRVWGNTINGNLTVNYATGQIDAIVNNTVTGNLLVQYSGAPVEVSGNHAANAACPHDTGRTGSGNVATGTNTCPH